MMYNIPEDYESVKNFCKVMNMPILQATNHDKSAKLEPFDEYDCYDQPEYGFKLKPFLKCAKKHNSINCYFVGENKSEAYTVFYLWQLSNTKYDPSAIKRVIKALGNAGFDFNLPSIRYITTVDTSVPLRYCIERNLGCSVLELLIESYGASSSLWVIPKVQCTDKKTLSYIVDALVARDRQDLVDEFFLTNCKQWDPSFLEMIMDKSNISQDVLSKAIHRCYYVPLLNIDGRMFFTRCPYYSENIPKVLNFLASKGAKSVLNDHCITAHSWGNMIINLFGEQKHTDLVNILRKKFDRVPGEAKCCKKSHQILKSNDKSNHSSVQIYKAWASQDLSVGWSSRGADQYYELRLWGDSTFYLETIMYRESSRHSQKKTVVFKGTYKKNKKENTISFTLDKEALEKQKEGVEYIRLMRKEVPSLDNPGKIENDTIILSDFSLPLKLFSVMDVVNKRPRFYSYVDGSY